MVSNFIVDVFANITEVNLLRRSKAYSSVSNHFQCPSNCNQNMLCIDTEAVKVHLLSGILFIVFNETLFLITRV